MTLDPIIKAKIQQYKKDYFLNELNEDQIFERFVNDNILSQMQPGVFKTEFELLDQICIGGGNDLGLDGIAISLNGQFIKSCTDIDDILIGNRKGTFEFIFIQSKNKVKFDLGEYMKFINGIETFLKETISMPHNDEVENWHKIFNYIMSNDMIIKWKCAPVIRTFFVVNGIWEENEHFISYSETFKENLKDKRCYADVETSFIDSKKLLEIVNVNENNYEFVMDLVDSMPLPEVSQVDNSSVVLCTAGELIKMLTTSDGLLRRNLFEDNVRDYQGETTINQEISNTIKNAAERFVLLNNGITIVCDEIKEMNRKVSIRNPQVVNGCQTCSVLFQSYKEKICIDNIYVIVKIIGSADNDIVNNIVKGTNRQNIVYEEAFEITRDFHKLLEQYFNSFMIENADKIYYERRSKQYDNNLLVKPYQRVNFRILIQSFVTMFLCKPEIGHKHESKLLHDYRNKIFQENQSFKQYYLAAYIYVYIEKMFRTNNINRDFYAYKMQIMLIFKELIGGKSPDINHKKEIERYCDDIIRKISNEEEKKKYVKKAVEAFENISNEWIDVKGTAYRDSRKDNPDFTKFLLNKLREERRDEIETKNVGKVLNVNTDRKGEFFGFIQREPQNIFFHEQSNPGINLTYEEKTVSYDVKKINGSVQAVNIKVLR